MKKGRKILIPVIAMLAFGVAGASLGTVAWFEVIRNIVAGDTDQALNVTSSSADLGDIKIKLFARTDLENPIQLSDSEGNRWGVVNRDGVYYYQALGKSNATLGTITFEAVALKQDGTEVDSNELIPYIGEKVKFVVSGDGPEGSRTRVSDSESTVYSVEPGTSSVAIEVTVANATQTSVTYSYSPNQIYYSVAGGITKNTGIKTGDICEDPTDFDGTGVGHIYVNGVNTNFEKGFGQYPQSRVTDSSIITELDKIETENARGYLEYNDKQYKKLKAKPYGSYNFDNGDPIVSGTTYYFEVEPIEWKIISNENNEAFLTSVLVLDIHRYAPSSNVYKSSEIRTWLNSEFYNKAFIAVQKYSIKVSEVDNSPASTQQDPNPYAGDSTNDKVFLLSKLELFGNTNVFPTNDSRICKTSEYARAKGAQSTSNNAWYYTRSPNAGRSDYAWSVHQGGSAYDYISVNYLYGGVRPALRLNLN